MVAVTFDTLKFVKTLKEAGVPEAQAEAFSIAVRDSHEAAELATKADLQAYESAIQGDLEKLETGLRHEIASLDQRMNAAITSLDQRMDAKMANMKFDLLKWIIGLAIAQTGLLMGFLRLFPVGSSFTPRRLIEFAGSC